ncbi:MAG: DUF4154 domain-containing protein [Geminicoccaceae bacterium]|nr:DUF4154 domain-containing protein [Geminicoccaceae bacterium]MCB9944213.1 DUF4154 domain-containing protein [Geminicoccaceae bacterium]
MGIWFRRISLPVLAYVVALGSVAEAAAERRDLEVVARSVGFLSDRPSGNVTVGVVIDPDVQQSLEESKTIESLISKGIKGPSLSLEAISVMVNDLSNLDGIDMLLITGGLASHHASIFAAASQRGLLTVSTDERCVDTGYCVMWVKGAPNVRIVVNRAAARASNISFQTSFRMLITER